MLLLVLSFIMLLIYAHLDYSHLSWFPPGRIDASLFLVLSCYCYMLSNLCWVPVIGSIFGDSDLYHYIFCQSFFDNLI
jgi:hypothetical protein